MTKNYTTFVFRIFGIAALTFVLTACGEETKPTPKKKSDGSIADAIDDQGDSLSAKVIYGEDNRLDVYQVQDRDLLALADSTVALIETKNIQESGGRANFTLRKYANSFAQPLCQDERFREQETAAFCSGFLVGPNLVATAGHCVQTAGTPTSDCETTRFVFGFKLPSATELPKSVASSEVYKCKRIVKQFLSSSGADYSVVELDREVTGHRPLRIRRSGALAVNDDLVVIGHPSGLPTKIAGGAKVRALYAAYVQTNLDTYGGNSGSAVFNATTKEVEGILVRGETDFISQNGCYASKRCDLDKCRGEDVTKISEILAYVPELSNPNPGTPPTPPAPPTPPTPEPPTPPTPRLAVYSAKPEVAIPDNNATGIQSTVNADQAPNGRKVKVTLNLTHSWRGDLVVSLTAPNGQVVLLSNRTGRSEDDIVGTYGDNLNPDQSLAAFSAITQTGSWKLTVTDRAARDTGKLIEWALKFE